MNTQLSVPGAKDLLGVPPVVSQLTALLPDGSEDPDRLNDCGEACLASVVAALQGLHYSPGCVRQALGSRQSGGVTTAADLSWYIERVGLHAMPLIIGDVAFREACVHLRRHGHYLIGLGTWNAPDLFHWRLFYGAHERNVWAMDPALGAYVVVPWAELARNYRGNSVRVGR